MLDELDPAIASTVCGGIRIGDDLARFERVAAVDAPEAAVFYAGRVLELLVAEAARLADADVSATVYGNLVRLSELGLLSELAARLTHALRRIANEARHVHRAFAAHDLELARALLAHVLRWHFSHNARGPRLATEWPRDTGPVAALIEALERGESITWDARLADSSFAIALYAEALIAEGRHELAAKHVADGLTRDPRDLRLRQLDAWVTRLAGDLPGAAAKLEALLDDGEDVETVGLLAGTYKRMGRTQRAAELYRRAWKQSDRKSAYAGINAASLTLLAGDRDGAKKIAATVDALFERRRTPAGIAFTGYWDAATYAEVKLVAGDTAEAARAYAHAFSRYADQRGSIASTAHQLALLLGMPEATPDALIASLTGG